MALLRYYNDILLITLFVQVGTMFSDYFWYTYLVVSRVYYRTL